MKMKYILISIIMFILPVFSVCACTWPGSNRQNELEYVIWQTDENEYGIELTFTVFARDGSRYGTFKYENKEYDILMGWSRNKVHIIYIGYYGNYIGYGDGGNDLQITGYYEIMAKDVVEIRFYNVYGDYEELKSLKDKKITVRATAIARDECDVSVIDGIMWQTENNEWKIYTDYGRRRFSVGTYGTGDEKTDIAVFWFADNKTFKAYKLKERTPSDDTSGTYIDITRIDGNAYIVGTYTNDPAQLHLTYTVDGENQPEISILHCNRIDKPNEDRWYPSSPDAAPLN